VGTDVECIVESVNSLLDNPGQYAQMAAAHNPYGDGKASLRIRDFLEDRVPVACFAAA
jgi:UDP-N-acetylglucosamine 2-epimerase (non-hydrolysing)